MASAVSKGARILVSGANGFLASHIVDQLLLAGFQVRGTVRALAKGKWMVDYFDQKYGAGRFELAEVTDMASPAAFEDAVKGISGVIHTASILTFAPDPNQVIVGTVEGTKNALRAATKESSVQRFVLTSSAAACTWPQPDKPFDLDENTWNNGAIERAWAPPPYDGIRAWDVYAASKAQSEQLLWEYVAKEKPQFVSNSVIPNTLFGPLLVPGKQQNTSTAGYVIGVYKTGLQGVDGIAPQYHVDVRDTARLHVAALIDSDLKNERIFAFADRWDWNKILAILRKLSPQHEFPPDLPNIRADQTRVLKKSRAEEILRKHFGTDFIGLEDTIKANVAHLL